MNVNQIVANATQLLALVDVFFGSKVAGIAFEFLKNTALVKGLTDAERASLDGNYADLVARKARVDAEVAGQ